MSHNERLQAVTGESTATIVNRILRVWQAARPADVEAGARWYAAGSAFIDELGAATGYSREHVAAVAAHLSPRTTWQRNLQGARDLLTGTVPTYCIAANVQRAQRALQAAEPLKTINGPKTRRFALNLLGEDDAVTVDVWAARIALGDREDAEALLSRVGVYDALEHAYRLAARRVGVSPSAMQATTWVVARNGRAD